MVYKVEQDNMSKISSLFEGCQDTLVWSCLQGCMGEAWTGNRDYPKSAQIISADFCFFAGTPNHELVKHKPDTYESDFIIMVPENEAWADLIEQVYGRHTKRITRYAIKKEYDVFDVEKLSVISNSLNSTYEVKLMDEKMYRAAKENKWSADLCGAFRDFEAYQEKGLGVVVLHEGELVSGASSYTVYDGGIEIQIDTREDYRRKGLALTCGARLIVECIKRDLYPSWDAANKGSVALAEKLGYHFDKEYAAYVVHAYG